MILAPDMSGGLEKHIYVHSATMAFLCRVCLRQKSVSRLYSVSSATEVLLGGLLPSLDRDMYYKCGGKREEGEHLNENTDSLKGQCHEKIPLTTIFEFFV